MLRVAGSPIRDLTRTREPSAVTARDGERVVTRDGGDGEAAQEEGEGDD